MTFESREISNQDGQIVSLYEFRWGDTYWRYTSADQEQTIEQEIEGVAEQVVYTPVSISDDGMVQGGSQSNDMTVTVQNDIPLVALFRGTPPSGSIWLTIRRRHMGDPVDDFYVHWLGSVYNVKKGGAYAASVICRSLLASFGRSGLRLAWTRTCPHMLYDSECRVNPEDFRVDATITAIDGDGTITLDAVDDKTAGYFDGGYVEWEATEEGTLDRRGIESSPTDTKLKLFGSTDRLEVGMEVGLYPGCNLVGTTCRDKFDNLANFGGFEQMTGDNPFDGRAVF